MHKVAKKEIPKLSVTTTENTEEVEQTTRKRKTLEELTIQDDYLFKRIMSEKDICLRFVQIILGIL